MDRPMIFNGRLGRNQIDTWLNLLNDTSESSNIEYKFAKTFLHLPESITFVSSLGNEIIGGTSIYRDRTRLAMVLASIAVKHEFRDSAAFQIVKSSLPFFKTVAIRDVDALVSIDGIFNTLGFPLNLELDPWVVEIIEQIGFVETDKLHHFSYTIDDGAIEKPIIWSNEFDRKEVKEFIWDQSKSSGLTNSFVWLAQDMAIASNSLATVSIEKRIAAVAGFWRLPNYLCVTPIITDLKCIDSAIIARSLIAEALENSVVRLELPLIGEGQLILTHALQGEGGYGSYRKLSLLRKSL